MSDWFRKKTWAKDDEEHFFTKLSRARKNGRAQYLKIQAIELLYTKDNKLLNIAKELLQKVLDDYPDNNLEKSSVYKTFGDIFLLEKNLEKQSNIIEKQLILKKFIQT
ncbi:hypothetical protein [Flavobacterium sp. 22076]|uniref:hypothetical protein n=1 Tax=unclassified Flavobacterium TaxID=196869 RepID=UPI003F85BAA9